MADARLLQDLPEELIREEILQRLGPEDLSVVRRVSHFHKHIASNNRLWLLKRQQHFINHNEQNDHLAEFIKSYLKNYVNLTYRQRRLISAFKENDLELIKSFNPTYTDLLKEVADGVPLALHTKNKTILNYCYTNVILPIFKQRIWTRQNTTPYTILWLAINFKMDAEHIDHLLLFNRGAPTETYHPHNEQPIHLAAKHDQDDIIDLLINKHGVLLNAIDNYNKTALFKAIEKKHIKTIKYLIEKKADLNIIATHPLPHTPLSFAAAEGESEIIQLLLEAGADPRIGVNENRTLPIHYAVLKGHLSCVKQLIEFDSGLLNSENTQRSSPLHFAIDYNHLDIVCYLLNQGANIDGKLNAPNSLKHDMTPLGLAAYHHHIESIFKLLEADADKNELLNYILQTDKNDLLTKLFASKADWLSQSEKNSLLARAAKENKPKILTCLLEQHADTTQQDEDGLTPCHIATIAGHTECVKVFANHSLAALATPFNHLGYPDHNKTLLYFAHEANQENVLEYLLEKIPERALFDTLSFAIQQNNYHLVKKIIKHKPILLGFTDTQKRTPLKIAYDEQMDSAIIKLLYKKNTFAEASSTVSKDLESINTLNAAIEELNSDLKNLVEPDFRLMIDTHDLLHTLNHSQISTEDKLAAIEAYRSTPHSISNIKFALCMAAVVAISLTITLGCMIAGALIGAAVTSWSGPGAALGSFFGATNGFSLGLSLSIMACSMVVGFSVELVLLSPVSFFGNTLRRHEAEQSTLKMADTAIALLPKRLAN